jgi:hypothetical protein
VGIEASQDQVSEAETLDVDTNSWVTKIIKKLGSLALAVLHAAIAIRESICTLKNFLTFFEVEALASPEAGHLAGVVQAARQGI